MMPLHFTGRSFQRWTLFAQSVGVVSTRQGQEYKTLTYRVAAGQEGSRRRQFAC
jgi:hypothetical protein